MTYATRLAPTLDDLQAALTPALLDRYWQIGRYRLPVVPLETQLDHHWISGDQGGPGEAGLRVAGQPVHSPVLERLLRDRNPALRTQRVTFQAFFDGQPDRAETVQFLELIAGTALRPDQPVLPPLRPGELRRPGGRTTVLALQERMRGYAADLYELLLPLMEAQWPGDSGFQTTLATLEELSGGRAHPGTPGVRIVMPEPETDDPALRAAVHASNVGWFGAQPQGGSGFPQAAVGCARRAILLSGPAKVGTPDRAAAVERLLLRMLSRHLR